MLKTTKPLATRLLLATGVMAGVSTLVLTLMMDHSALVWLARIFSFVLSIVCVLNLPIGTAPITNNSEDRSRLGGCAGAITGMIIIAGAALVWFVYAMSKFR